MNYVNHYLELCNDFGNICRNFVAPLLFVLGNFKTRNMETRNVTFLKTDNEVMTNVDNGNSNFKKLVYGNYSPGEVVTRILVHPQTPLHHLELKRLNDMKLNFISIAGDKLGEPSFFMDKIWATAKSFARQLNSKKLK